MATDKSPFEEPDPNDSPFELVPIEGLPFDKDSEEARAIERILAWDKHDPESPFELVPIEGLPFAKDSEEARAIERILAWNRQEP